MYGNMTREEMIQRLYEGNFTTGELERQLIAKLFEQCCGGEGSSGGGVLIVHGSYDEQTDVTTLDKTAAEIFGAFQSSGVIVHLEDGGGAQMYETLSSVDVLTNGEYHFQVSDVSYGAQDGNSYPTAR